MESCKESEIYSIYSMNSQMEQNYGQFKWTAVSGFKFQNDKILDLSFKLGKILD